MFNFKNLLKMKNYFLRRMKSIILLSFVTSMFVLTNCDKDEDKVDNGQSTSEKDTGVFVINEGSFGNENSSLSFINNETGDITNDMFYDKNNRPLGDVFQSMNIINEKAYMVINGSSVIEVIDPETIESEATITDFTSPRYIIPINDSKAYVSDLFAGKIWIVCLDDNQIEDNIEFSAGWSEYMIEYGNNIFVTAPDVDKVYKINPETHSIIDEVEVQSMPSTMIVDKNDVIWVISGGRYDFGTGEQIEAGGITAIDAEDMEVITELTFPKDGVSYSNIQICEDGETIYYIGGGVWELSISDDELPSEPIIESNGNFFYGLGVCPKLGDFYISDPKDFNQRGEVLIYNSEGELKNSFSSGIVPSGFLFY